MTETGEAPDRNYRGRFRLKGRNLREHILPTRERADLVLEKSADHSVRAVRLRKL